MWKIVWRPDKLPYENKQSFCTCPPAAALPRLGLTNGDGSKSVLKQSWTQIPMFCMMSINRVQRLKTRATHTHTHSSPHHWCFGPPYAGLLCFGCLLLTRPVKLGRFQGAFRPKHPLEKGEAAPVPSRTQGSTPTPQRGTAQLSSRPYSLRRGSFGWRARTSP